VATITVTVCDLTREEGDVAKTPIMVGDLTVAEMELGPNGTKMVEEAIRAALEALVDEAPARGVQPLAPPARSRRQTQPQPDDDEADDEAGGDPVTVDGVELRLTFTTEERARCKAWGMRHWRTPAVALPKPPAKNGQVSRRLAEAWVAAGRP